MNFLTHLREIENIVFPSSKSKVGVFILIMEVMRICSGFVNKGYPTFKLFKMKSSTSRCLKRIGNVEFFLENGRNPH
jgi:hypothetical protein